MKPSSNLLFAVAVSLLAPVAEAHVALSTSPVIAGASQELTFNVGHGCSGADTVKLEVRIPEGITSVRPLDAVFGKAVVTKDATSGLVTAVTWTKAEADVLPADTQLYKVALSAKLPDKPFTRLFFPTYQTCRAANGATTVVEWVGETTEHDHGSTGTTTPTAEPAPTAFLLPARTPGWNKYTVNEHVHDMTVFKDAQIVWSGNTAYSPNAAVLGLIQQEQNTQVLAEIHPGTDIWVKY